MVRVVSFSDRNNGYDSFPSYPFEFIDQEGIVGNVLEDVETDHVGVCFVLER